MKRSRKKKLHLENATRLAKTLAYIFYSILHFESLFERWSFGNKRDYCQIEILRGNMVKFCRDYTFVDFTLMRNLYTFEEFSKKNYFHFRVNYLVIFFRGKWLLFTPASSILYFERAVNFPGISCWLRIHN